MYYTDDWKGNYIPIISCLPEYYKLKPELHALLDYCKLSDFKPAFLNEIPWGEMFKRSINNLHYYFITIELLNIYLLNHNNPIPLIKKYFIKI